uniref:NADH-ubiquinone oxidoreductase chain 3 n=2 Tax=Pinctada TaxID=50425 RepID=A0A343B6L2_PINIB|nr:NADH dehydrogenase subunit 3 [Pinctada imbricata]BAL15368.1 NADH dehydrogenase subunit 3 [Pinctada fucata]
MVSAVFVSLMFGVGLLLLGYNLAKYQEIDWEKGSPYECGFDPVGQAWNPVPMRFFHMVLLFLLWEAETMLLIPLMMWSWRGGGSDLGVVGFILILLAGLLYEWTEGTLEWCPT